MRTRTRPKRKRPASGRAQATARASAAARLIANARELCGFENRLAGTDAERRAGNWLAERLRESGRAAELEPTYVHPQAPLVYALHCALGFAGSLVAVAVPALGFGLVLVAATSMYLDLNSRFYLLRRLFFRRASQNVVSPGSNPLADSRVLIVAHYDVARTGAVFQPRWRKRNDLVSRLLPVPFGAYRPLFWSLAILMPLLGARMAGIDSGVLALVQLIPTLSLLVGLFFLVDIELSEPVPGADDNASGVAVALELAERLEAHPLESIDAWIVLTGGKECQSEGFRAFLRAHRKRHKRTPTLVVNLDTLGRGELRYLTSEGPAVSFGMHPRLIEICAALGGTDEDSDRRARPLLTGHSDDAFAARIAGLGAITLTGLDPTSYTAPDQHTADDLPDRLDGAAMAHAADFAWDVLDGLDRDAARAATRG